MIYARHFVGRGVDLFSAVCELDLEGVVAKRMDGAYGQNWFKIRNPRYSQWAGRHELFERDRRSEPVPGWHSCELACANVGAI